MKGISGSALKVIACATMLIDHMGMWLLPQCAWAVEPLFTLLGVKVTWRLISRIVGRVAFPIFAFLIVEGFKYTHNRLQYALNLLAFAIITEIPWNLLHNGTIFYLASQNVLWTLLAGFLGMCAYERLEGKPWLQLFALFGLAAAVFVGHGNYSISGFPFIMLLYALGNRRSLQALTAAVLLPMKPFPALAFIPISLYNGQRGFVKGKAWKYAFYAFYPAHLFIIYLLK